MCTNLGAALNLALGSEPRGKGIGALSLLDFGAAERIAQERLATLQVRLDDLWRPVGMLSGGQRQSVAIARVAGPGVSVGSSTSRPPRCRSARPATCSTSCGASPTAARP